MNSINNSTPPKKPSPPSSSEKSEKKVSESTSHPSSGSTSGPSSHSASAASSPTSKSESGSVMNDSGAHPSPHPEVSPNLHQILAESLEQIKKSTSQENLYQVKVAFTGKNGTITGLMRLMNGLSKEERPAFGQSVNSIKQTFEQAYVKKEEVLLRQEIESQLKKEDLDLTLPLYLPQTLRQAPGNLHPTTLVLQEITGILSRLGYATRQGPLIETDYYNFEALNIPAHHPARDMQDTFFVDETHVLRTHTSPIQIHTLESEAPPLRILGIGPVFRCDSDLSHLPQFHQIEGMCVDKKISMSDLKGTISFFVQNFFGPDTGTRFRPSFFPFTEPSAEMDCTCPLCKGKGCSLCKHTGWIEIGGCGLINPKVLIHSKVAYPEWTGFAFGFGIERMALIKYGIDDIRLLPENDLRFLQQFGRLGLL